MWVGIGVQMVGLLMACMWKWLALTVRGVYSVLCV